MKVNVLKDRIFKILDDSRKVGRNPLTLNDIDRFLWNIDSINAMQRGEVRYNNILLSDISIPKVFSSFIYPNSITCNAKTSNFDFLVRPVIDVPETSEDGTTDVSENSNHTPMSLFEFQEFIAKFNAAFKISNSNDSCHIEKLNVTLTDAGEMSGYYYTGSQYVTSFDNNKSVINPVELSVQLHEEHRYTELIEEWITTKFRDEILNL